MDAVPWDANKMTHNRKLMMNKDDNRIDFDLNAISPFVNVFGRQKGKWCFVLIIVGMRKNFI